VVFDLHQNGRGTELIIAVEDEMECCAQPMLGRSHFPRKGASRARLQNRSPLWAVGPAAGGPFVGDTGKVLWIPVVLGEMHGMDQAVEPSRRHRR
jgi:hypothetical protein